MRLLLQTSWGALREVVFCPLERYMHKTRPFLALGSRRFLGSAKVSSLSGRYALATEDAAFKHVMNKEQLRN
jgi:hypothetical protein